MLFERLLFSSYPRFLVIGALTFFLELILMTVLLHITPLSEFFVRSISVPSAVIFSYLLHKPFTYQNKTPYTLTEFIKYACKTWLTLITNILVYWGCLSLISDWFAGWAISLTFATAVSSTISFFAYQKIFKRRTQD